jgi:hypothetical protein
MPLSMLYKKNVNSKLRNATDKKEVDIIIEQYLAKYYIA